MNYSKTNKNFIYNLTYEGLCVLTPLIITPYVSRVLGAELIGVRSYTYAILSYFLLFSNLGIAVYGQREIAKSYYDKNQRSVIFFTLLVIKVISFTIVLIVYCITFFVEGVLSQYRIVFFVWLLQLFESVVNITWYFQGAEKFKYIAIRGIILRTLQIVLVLSFVKSKDDFLLYIALFSGIPLLQAAVLWPFMISEVNWRNFQVVNLRMHIKKVLIFFIPAIATTIYSSVDKIMLGSMLESTQQTGFYESAQKIALLCTTIFLSVYSVMRSRVSAEITNHSSTIDQSIPYFIRIALLVIVPVTLGVLSVTDNFVIVFYGEEYIPVIGMLKMFTLVILFVGLSSFIAAIYIVPYDKQNYLSIFYIIATATNIIINALLIPVFAAFGAIAGSVAAEGVVLLGCAILSKDFLPISKYLINGWRYIVSGIVMFITVYLLSTHLNTGLLPLCVEILCGVIIYFSMLLILNDSVVCSLFRRIAGKIYLDKE